MADRVDDGELIIQALQSNPELRLTRVDGQRFVKLYWATDLEQWEVFQAERRVLRAGVAANMDRFLYRGDDLEKALRALNGIFP